MGVVPGWEILRAFRLKTRRPRPGKSSSISKLSIGLFSGSTFFHQMAQRGHVPLTLTQF